MKMSVIRQRLKPWMLPIAMLVGLLLHNVINAVAFLAPYLIFTMLLITFCRVRFNAIRPDRLTWLLLGVQVLGGLLVYLAFRPLGDTLAQGAFICVFCPTATAAPVIASMLGGNIVRLITFSLASNAVVALLAPSLFALMGPESGMTLAEGTLAIAQHVVPLILAPLAVAIALQHTLPAVHSFMGSHQGLSFYIWAVSLVIVVGRAVAFVMAEPSREIPVMLGLAGVSLLMCLAQFAIGRVIGRRQGDPVVGAQGLGQKNTVLAIWMALTYLNPVSSVAPAAYVAWQNTINSIQLYYRTRRQTKP